jgi:uncharacterized repeat protein (TIGR01451 family)
MGQTMAGGRATRLGRRSIRSLATLVGLALAGTGGVAGLAPGNAAAAEPPPPLQVTVTVDNREITPPATLTYTIVVSASTVDGAAIPAVEVVDELPAGVTPVSQTSPDATTIEGRSVRWSLGDMADSVWKTVLTVSVDAGAPAMLRNVVVATSSDGRRVASSPAATTMAVAPTTPPPSPPPTAKVLAGVITRPAPRELPRTGSPITLLVAIAAVALLLGAATERATRATSADRG